MTPEQIAAGCLADEIESLDAAIRLLGAFGSLFDHAVWHATHGPEGPLVALYIASDEIDRIGYIGDDPAWWHPDVRAAKLTDLTETRARMEAPIKAACRAILEHRPGQ